MEIEFDKAKIIQDEDGFWLCLKVEWIDKARRYVYSFADKIHIAKLTIKRNKRSTDANAYAWLLMGRIATALRTDKNSVYLHMLSRYGVFVTLSVPPEAVERMKLEWREVEILGKVLIGGETKIQLNCYFGSSTYNTQEMSTLISGIVDECKDLDIETATPRELALMCEEWGT